MGLLDKLFGSIRDSENARLRSGYTAGDFGMDAQETELFRNSENDSWDFSEDPADMDDVDYHSEDDI